MSIATPAELDATTNDPLHLNRRWLRAPMVDCTLSFVAVIIFTAVFVACGAVILGPEHKVPDGTNLLSLQAAFVTPIYPWLKYVYFAGALMTILGTLYGTIEVAPAVLREITRPFNTEVALRHAPRLRLLAVLWVGLAGLALLMWSFSYHLNSGKPNPPGLIPLLTPANLFTGVLGCGLICLLNLWIDRRFLPPQLRMTSLLFFLNAVAGAVFLALGIKGYWDHNGWTAFVILAGTVAVGLLAALVRERVSNS